MQVRTDTFTTDATPRLNSSPAAAPQQESPRLRGVIVPLVTPLLDHDTLDRAGLETLVQHLVQGGVHGIFVLGTTGEGPALSYRMRREVIRRVAELAEGRTPWVVGITDTAFAESLALADYAAEHGATAAVVAPPFYYPVAQPELLGYIEHLVDAVSLPVVLYNMPSHTKVAWEPATVRRAAALKGVIGLKDSSGDMPYFRRVQRLLADRPAFSLLIGPEDLLAEALRAGASGGVPGGANLFPQLYVRLYESAQRGDWDTVQALHEQVMAISQSLYGVGQHGSSYLRGLKCALACRGICNDFMAEPFRRFSPARRRIVETKLAELDGWEEPVG